MYQILFPTYFRSSKSVDGSMLNQKFGTCSTKTSSTWPLQQPIHRRRRPIYCVNTSRLAFVGLWRHQRTGSRATHAPPSATDGCGTQDPSADVQHVAPVCGEKFFSEKLCCNLFVKWFRIILSVCINLCNL